LLTTTASIAQAGGFEAQTLDTGFMYEEGAVLTASTASLNSNLTEANGTKILKDQNFTNFFDQVESWAPRRRTDHISLWCHPNERCGQPYLIT
ncbi:hypothetical protein N9X22_00710, partial [Planktomarina temperata]|nr:hypothetical protein [Planktomarina temperata]